jgi:hypothetical protein
MNARAYDLIREAIETKQQVFATYRTFARGVCPHVLGWKDGEAHAFCFQFFGESSQGLDPNPRRRWRCLRLAELENIRLREGRWHTAPYEESQSCIDDVDVVVEGFEP